MPDYPDDSVLTRLQAAGGGLLSGALGGQLLSDLALAGAATLPSVLDRPATKGDIISLYQGAGTDEQSRKNKRGTYRRGPVEIREGPRATLVLPRKAELRGVRPAYAAKAMGHATSSNLRRKLLQGKPARALGHAAIPAALVYSMLGDRPKDESVLPEAGLALALSAPRLAEEGMATAKAVKGLQAVKEHATARAGRSASGLNAKRLISLLGSFGAHASKPAAAILGALAAKQLYKGLVSEDTPV